MALRRARLVFLLGSLALLLVACGGDEEDATATAAPAAAEATPTEQITTPEPEPTETPEPTATATPEPEPTATPTRFVPAPTVAAPLYIPPTAVPTSPPEPTPESEEPSEPSEGGSIGELLLATDLTDWPVVEYDFGRGYPGEGGYYIQVHATDGSAIFLRDTQTNFTDVVASVDLQLMTPDSPNTWGCLITHADAINTDYNYSLCINGWGDSLAAYEYVDQDGNYQTEILIELDMHPGLNAPTEVNTLTIVSNGIDFGFFLNDTLIGTASHSGPPSGAVGFYVAGYDAEPGEYRFTNLEVWEIVQ